MCLTVSIMLQTQTRYSTTDLANLAIQQLHQTGCEYGEIRLCRYRTQTLMARDRSLTTLSDNISSGYGIRVLLNGAWGFAASNEKTPEALTRTLNCQGNASHPTATRAFSPGRSLSGYLHHSHCC
jgi:TldD protein